MQAVKRKEWLKSLMPGDEVLIRSVGTTGIEGETATVRAIGPNYVTAGGKRFGASTGREVFGSDRFGVVSVQERALLVELTPELREAIDAAVARQRIRKLFSDPFVRNQAWCMAAKMLEDSR